MRTHNTLATAVATGMLIAGCSSAEAPETQLPASEAQISESQTTAEHALQLGAAILSASRDGLVTEGVEPLVYGPNSNTYPATDIEIVEQISEEQREPITLIMHQEVAHGDNTYEYMAIGVKAEADIPEHDGGPVLVASDSVHSITLNAQKCPMVNGAPDCESREDVGSAYVTYEYAENTGWTKTPENGTDETEKLVQESLFDGELHLASN